MKIKLLLFCLFLFCLNAGFAGEKDSLKTSGSSTYNYSKAPSIGYNLGYLNFFGDVKLNGYQPSFASRLGHQFYISFPLSNSFSLSYNFIAGKIYGEETRGADNLNFRSSLVGQALMFEYNFYNIIKPDADSKFTVLPVIGFGLEALIFRGKADMENAAGKKYYYWEDGTIKDLPQTSANEDLAVTIERDYSYETELRDANLDGFGKYSQITFAMPFTVGADLRVGRNFSFRLGATYHLTFSDMLDNLSSVGSGNRQGNEGKDMFLFSSLGVSYKFAAPKAKKEKPVDIDEDGVADVVDKCRDTPKGVKVDKQGCPQVNEIDRDGDGVLDVVDRCRDSKQGEPVDKEGCSVEQKTAMAVAAVLKDSLAKSEAEKQKLEADAKAKLAEESKIAEAKAFQEAEVRNSNDGFYFADLNKNGRVEVSEVNEFIERLFDGDKNVTIATMEEIIEYYFDQDGPAEMKPAEIKAEEKKIVEKLKPAEFKATPETETKQVGPKATVETETKPVEAKGALGSEKKPLDPKFHFADLNKNGRIEKEELDIFIDRMEKGDKSVPIKTVDEILEYYFNQDIK